MAKKCIPGVICVENMTLFLIIIFTIFLVYFYVSVISKQQRTGNAFPVNSGPLEVKIVSNENDSLPMLKNAISTRKSDILSNPYVPPEKVDYGFPAMPVYFDFQYAQKGILTKSGGRGENTILPLMGRRIQRNRDKWQYYTMMNSGNFATKLPISSNGRSCTNEYGCNELMNGDRVYVEGYNDVFEVTIYENSLFNYNPLNY
jgi:hypothetical protein